MQKRIKQAQKYLEWEKPNQAIAELKPTLNSKQIQREFKWVPNHMMGIALSLKGEHKVSAGYLEKAVQHGSEQAETYHMLSVNYYNLGQFEKAEKYGKEAIDRKESFLKAWLNLGSVYRSQAKLDEALECYKKANQIDPTNAGVAFRIGEIYRDQGDLDQAMKLFDITLKIEENHIRAMLEKADIYKKKGDLDEALQNLGQAREVHGDHITIKVSEAEIYKSQGDYDKAINLYESLLEKQPKSWALRVNYALCLQEVSRFNESEKNYRKAIEDMEGAREAISNYLMGLHYNPQNSKEYIYDEHVRLGKEFIPESPSGRAMPADKSKDKKLKIGFVSGGFRRHPVGWMIAGALEQLPDDEFELYCYTTNNKFDFVTRRIHQNIDTWRSVVGYSSDVIENLIREDELDILVDLSGHASDNCMDVMASEPAPVMVKWVGGLFNTTGLEAFDYLISDKWESPKGEEQYYTEKLVRMPDDYITYTPPAYAPDVEELPAKRNGHITFGCFNNPTKVNEQVLYHWAGIMREIPESQLYLKSKQYDTASFRDQIVQKMKEEDIAEERILFEGHTAHDEHLEAYNNIDIALDPWPYSGGLTTCEALYMGVPVITMPGPTFAGRHSTTHLINAGLPQWVTKSWEEYINKTVALASNWDELEAWRCKLRNQLRNSPVCDGKRFGAHLSVAFREMWKQRVEGYQNEVDKWQDHITIDPLSDAQVQELTDGPDIMPPISVKDTGGTAVDAITKNKGIQNQTTEESMIDTEELVPNAAKNRNGKSKKDGAAALHSKSSDKEDDTYFIEIKDDVTICTPADLDVLTTYVLLEQEEWFEPELNFVRQFVQAGMHIVDVGAGFGAYALPMAKQVGSEGRVSAFEPVTDTRSCLEKSKIENGLNQLEVYVHGLAEETKRAAVERAETPELYVLTEGDEIPLSTLDKWWGFIGQPDIDLVKIDVNGMESQVLEGGQTLFNKTSPVVIASIGEETDSLQKLQAQFKEIDYKLYEYIPGPGLLAEHDPEAGVDPYLINLVGIPQSRIEEFKESGWIFDDGVEVEAADLRGWESILGEMPWTESLMDNWKQNVDAGNHDEYLKALNLICTAEQIDMEESTDNKLRSRKGAMMLQAAQILIGLFNSRKAGISAALTYVRVMSQLGKRSQAVEMMKQLMETVNSGSDISAELPFLPPLKEQDETDIQTDFSKWLTVRIVEGWITLKNPTMYMADEQDQKMLEALEGNPEKSDVVLPWSIFSGMKKESSQENLNKEKPRLFVHFFFNNMHSDNTLSLLENLPGDRDRHISFVEMRRSVQHFSIDVEKKKDVYGFYCKRDLEGVIQKISEWNPDAIVMHGLFFDWQKEIVRKADFSGKKYWVIWGGDLYNPISANRPIYDVVSSLDGVITNKQADYDTFTKTYGSAHYVDSFSFGVASNIKRLANEVSKVNPPRIVVGNSGDPSNYHVEILSILSEKKDISQFQLYVPFAYNGSEEYLERIKSEIKTLGLGDQTVIQEEFLPSDEYERILMESSYYISAHKRQQSMGTINLAKYFGNVTFLREKIMQQGQEVTSPNWEITVNERGLKAYSLQRLKELQNLSDIKLPEESVVEEERSRLDFYVDEDKAIDRLTSCFDQIKDNLK